MSEEKVRTGEFHTAAQILQLFSDFAVRAAFVFFFGSIAAFTNSFGYCRENFMVLSGILFLLAGIAGHRFAGKASFRSRIICLEALALLAGGMLLTGHKISGCAAAYLFAGLGCGFVFPGFCRKWEFLLWSAAFALLALLKDTPWFLVGIYLLVFAGLSGSIVARRSWKNWILPVIFLLCGTFFYIQVLRFIPETVRPSPDSSREEQEHLTLFYGLAQLPYYPDRVLYITSSGAPESVPDVWNVFPEFPVKILPLYDPETGLEQLSDCQAVPLILFDCPLPVSGLESLYLSEKFLMGLRQTLCANGVLVIRFPVNRSERSERRWLLVKQFAEERLLAQFREVKTPPGFGNIFLCGDNICVVPEELEDYNEEHHYTGIIPPNLMEVLQQMEPSETAVADGRKTNLLRFPLRYFLASEPIPVSMEYGMTAAGRFLERFRFGILLLLSCFYFAVRYFCSGGFPRKKVFRGFEHGIYLGIIAGILLNRIFVMIPESLWRILLIGCFFLALFCFQRKKPTFAQRCLALCLPWLWLLLTYCPVNFRIGEFLLFGGGLIFVFLVILMTGYAIGEALVETAKIPLLLGGCAGAFLTTMFLLTSGGLSLCCLTASVCALLTFLPLKQEQTVMQTVKR